jgi:hypothetical protein
MSIELREYAAAKVGQVWTSGDHEFLVATLSRIDQTCVDIWSHISQQAREVTKRLNELLSLETGPPRRNPDALHLPFDDLTDDVPQISRPLVECIFFLPQNDDDFW